MTKISIEDDMSSLEVKVKDYSEMTVWKIIKALFNSHGGQCGDNENRNTRLQEWLISTWLKMKETWKQLYS